MSRILVIDDQPEVLEVMRRILAGAGYEVEVAAGGDVGIRLHGKKPFDLIMTDLVMPDKEGIETIMEIRRADRKVKIIAISGFIDSPYLDTARHLGANRILPKPCSRQIILEAVRDLLAENTSPAPPAQPPAA